MARLEIEMNLDNAAFEERGRDEEIARILHKLADSFLEPADGDSWVLVDCNGNRIGGCSITDA